MNDQHAMENNQPEKKRLGKMNNVDELVSKNFRNKRIMLGLSQERIGMEIGVSIQQVQKYEKGTNRISSGKLYQIANFFRVPITYFYENYSKSEDDIEDCKSFVHEEDEYEKETYAFMKAFNKIKNPQCRKKLVELVRAMEQLNRATEIKESA